MAKKALLIQINPPHYTDKKAAKGEGFSERFFDFLEKERSSQMSTLHYTDISSLECKVFGENICKNLSLQHFGSSKVVQLTTERSLLEAQKHSQIIKQNKDYPLNRMVVLIFTQHCFSHLRRSQHSTI